MTDKEIRKLTRGFFSKKELECKCRECQKSDNPKCSMDKEFLRKLTLLRMILNIPFTPNSGYRCLENFLWSPNHGGNAVDIPCEDSNMRFKVVNAALMSMFTRIGISDNFVHIDNNPMHDNGPLETVIWLYSKGDKDNK